MASGVGKEKLWALLLWFLPSNLVFRIWLSSKETHASAYWAILENHLWSFNSHNLDPDFKESLPKLSSAGRQPVSSPSFSPQDLEANTTLIIQPLLTKPWRHGHRPITKMATYHSHFGEIDKAFFRKVWCSFFNEGQVCQVHSEVRDSRGVTAARPGRGVLIPAHTQLRLAPQENSFCWADSETL